MSLPGPRSRHRLHPGPRLLLLLLPLLLVSADSCSRRPRTAITTGSIVPLEFKNGVSLQAELALNRNSHRIGLMHRTADNLPPDRGMLFVFPEKEIRSFWMKNTLIPLDIAFIDDTGTIRQIERMEPHDLSSTKSRDELRYALETHAGWFAEQGVQVGDRIENFDRYLDSFRKVERQAP